MGAAFRFGWGGAGDDGERPTSRGRSPAARWATLPCPDGQGALRVCVFDAVCPAGKGAAEWRAGSLAYHGRKQGIQAFCPSGEFAGAPGNGGSGCRADHRQRECSRHAGEQGRCALPRKRRRRLSPRKRDAPFSRQPLPHHPSAANAALYRHASPPSLFAANIRRMHPTPASLARKLPTFRPSRRRLILRLPAGRPAGSARTRPRDQSLGDPFLEPTSAPSRLPSPKNRRRLQAPARGLAAVNFHHRPNRTETKRPSPLLMGLGRVNPEPKALATGTAGWPAALPPAAC